MQPNPPNEGLGHEVNDTEVVEKVATFVKRLDGNGEGRIYQLSPPMPLKNWNDEDEGSTEYVWVSAAITYSGPETYIFASDADGDVTSWTERPGSFRGGMDHEEALRGAGYRIGGES